MLEGMWPDARPPVPRQVDRQGLGTSGTVVASGGGGSVRFHVCMDG